MVAYAPPLTPSRLATAPDPPESDAALPAFLASLPRPPTWLEDLAAFLFHEHAEDFAHSPSRDANHLQADRHGLQQRDAAIANHANRVGITLESLQLETGEIEALQLLGRIGHGLWRLRGSGLPLPDRLGGKPKSERRKAASYIL